MKIFSSLTNRIFIASALLAVVSIAAAIYMVNAAVTTKDEQELRRGLDEAGTLIEANRRERVEHFTREARLVADIPQIKATVELNHPRTMLELAKVYHDELSADLFLVTNRNGETLALLSSPVAAAGTYTDLPGVRDAVKGREANYFWPHPGGMLQIVSVPIWIDPQLPDIKGTLSVGFSLDDRQAARVRDLSGSDVAFALNGTIQASTLPREVWPALTTLLDREGLWERVPLGADDYIAVSRPLPSMDPSTELSPAATPTTRDRATAIILLSRTERLKFLRALHWSLFVTAMVAVLAATLLSYFIARTITKPLGTVTTAMRNVAATGDLAHRIPLPPSDRWQDEDARLLTSAFNTLTESVARFQREVTQRERLSSLGRLSTVIAHEIRNPLMIIKAALRNLRTAEVSRAEVTAAAADIDEEISRLNRIVGEVLDFARPIKFELAAADLNAVCQDAARATGADAGPAISLELDPAMPPLVTDAERLRHALVNILTNARLAVAERPAPHSGDGVRLTTRAVNGRVVIDIRDHGGGIAVEDLPRIFEPYFTTRRTGSGLGLAISRNIIEGLGGTIGVSSRRGEGTDVRIELPVNAA
jgi:signal transduction histidine kinase